MNETIKNKLKELVTKSKTMTVEDAIRWIKNLFPKEEFVWNEIRFRDECFYRDYRDKIAVDEDTQLTIIYPGGDIYPQGMAMPYTSIHLSHIDWPEVEDIEAEFDDDYTEPKDKYLFYEDVYNPENKILEYLENMTFPDFSKSIDIEYANNSVYIAEASSSGCRYDILSKQHLLEEVCNYILDILDENNEYSIEIKRKEND